MGKKYIIELEDKPFHKDGDFLCRVKGFNSLVFDMTGIGMLTPYTEPDLEQVAESGKRAMYQKGLKDAWEAARTLWNTLNRKEIFGHTAFITALTTLTAQETIEKIRQYEQEKEESEKLKKEQSVTAEEIMRQYLDTFCKGKSCTGCPLHTPDFTCGRGYHFLTNKQVSDEEVRKAYAAVLAKMKE